MTLRLLSILRLMNPHVLLPATTALGTIHPQGKGNGNSVRCQRGDAESLAGFRAGKI